MDQEHGTGPLIEHLFRHQFGRIVAHLARVLGPAHLALAEESAQESMLRAMQTWAYQGVPDNPVAWLFRVAHNHAIDAIRRSRSFAEKTDAVVAQLTPPAIRDEPDPLVEEQLRDDELRMIFLCCHPAFSTDVSVVLSLNTVGGFSVREIARSLLTQEATIAQRLVRAKRQIRDGRVTLEMPAPAELPRRVRAVLDVIYLMFSEGYASHDGEELIRQDVCLEALRLARLLALSSLATPEAHALTALISLQAARLPARLDQAGELVLLEDQDRTQWDHRLIGLGFHHFDRSIGGETVTEYHIQAALAATYSRVTQDGIDWRLILELYDQLFALNPSPVIALNRAVAVARVHGPAIALPLVDEIALDERLRRYYLMLAVRGHLLSMLGRTAEAAECFRAALDCHCSAPERKFLAKKLAACLAPAKEADQ